MKLTLDFDQLRVLQDALREYGMGLRSFITDAENEGDREEIGGIRSDLETVEALLTKLGAK